MKNSESILSKSYPEVNVGGYTSIDGTIEFYGRINAILKKEMTVLDFGAGRAEWFEDDQCEYRKNLRLIKGKVNKVIACDVDEAVLHNNSADETVVTDPLEKLPFDDEYFDIVIADFTFEHIDDSAKVAAEFERILKKGGWICARTPNKYSYVSFFARVVKNKYHKKLLKYVQPGRKEVDVFPTYFNLNRKKVIEKYFPENGFRNQTYYFEPEPAYYFNSRVIFIIMNALNKFLPSCMKSNIFIFLQKYE